jgi:hypothetical protein
MSAQAFWKSFKHIFDDESEKEELERQKAIDDVKEAIKKYTAAVKIPRN